MAWHPKTLLVSLSALGLVAAACGRSAKSPVGSAKATTATTAEAQMAPHTSGDIGSYLLKAAEQHGNGKAVVVEDAVLTGASGWVVVNEQMAGGAMGDVLGESALLGPGAHMSVTVPLMHPLSGSAAVVAVLHLQANSSATFDPAVDQPAKVGGQDVEVPITVDVP